MDFLSTELRDKPIIGIISGGGSWLLYQINTTPSLGFFADTNPVWGVMSKVGIMMGVLIASLTVVLKAREVYKEFTDKK